MECPDAVKRLVEQFTRQSDQICSPEYNETQLRVDFINPLFAALGWDMDNRLGYAEQYREVVHEDRVKIAGTTKAPDYSFRIGGIRKFFLEAKKPAVNIKQAWEPAYQLRRYAWSAKLPVSILTDFEELAIYDCRIAPKQMDKPSTARREYITYTDYRDRWDFLYGTFSKDAVLKGDFDRYCATQKGRGAQEFDEAFLIEIEEWRKKLATNIALRNELNEHDLNFATQRIIDRIIFLRICEDRGVEPAGHLQQLLNGENTYKRLVGLFRDADARYNSGLFHFKREAGREEAPDELTLDLEVDDVALKTILKRLYYPESPYEFTVVSADILGSVYERFLGNVIERRGEHGIRVVEKPEVRKAGGVYYTPTYIVDYIVKQTVGKLLEGKTPKDAAELRVLDPACGSGSFLLGAYQYLLDWHLKWYVADGPQKWSKGKSATIRPADRPSFTTGNAGSIVRISDGDTSSAAPTPQQTRELGHWALTIAERKRILLDNIHGVDIDYQAVEVTKLSLLLRCLEGETAESLRAFSTLFRERALPDLGRNVQCGNSLIGTDILTSGTWEEMGEEERSRINPFDWKRAFPRAFRNGGFDAVIGNPPYGYMIREHEQAYYRSVFQHQDYQLDNYQLFLERSLTELLRSPGRFGMIIPNPWLTNITQRALRRMVVADSTVDEIVHFEFPVFSAATVDTEIVILSKPRRLANRPIAYFAVAPEETRRNTARRVIHNQDRWIASDGGVINISVDEISESLAAKLRKDSSEVVSLFAVNVGIKPYQVGKGTPQQTRKTVDERPFDSDRALNHTYRACLRGSDIGRYVIAPEAPRFLSYGPWLAEPRPAANFDAPVKIFMRQTGDSLIAALDNKRHICLNNMHVLVPRTREVPVEGAIAILNSRLMNWYYQTINPERGEALAEVKRAHVAGLPLHVNGDNRILKKLKELATSMLSLRAEELKAKHPQKKEQLQRRIEATDRQIDQIVYQIYNLSDHEISLVEKSTQPESE